MAIITGPGSVIKGVREDLFFDKDQFLASVTISDPFFANERNWKRVALVFKDPAKKQKRQTQSRWRTVGVGPSKNSCNVWQMDE